MHFIFSDWLNTVNVHNREILIDAIDNRPKGTPLITLCNHHSCLDDPMLWGKCYLNFLTLLKLIFTAKPIYLESHVEKKFKLEIKNFELKR